MYPRPDFQRTSLNWHSLDGEWDFSFDDSDTGLSSKWHHGLPEKRTIKVPFAFQTSASGVGLREDHELIWYQRTITDIRTADERARGNRLLVRFGAVDYECTVYLDGQLVGGHRGGHVPFDVDLTDALAGESGRLTLRVRDSPYDLTQPRGKQYWKPVSEDIFYMPTSGIWLSVWLESVPRLRLGSGSEGTVLRSDDIVNGQLHCTVAVLGRKPGQKCTLEIEAKLNGDTVGTASVEFKRETNTVTTCVGMKLEDKQAAGLDGVRDGVALWAPEHPTLYDIILRVKDDSGLADEVNTTTGMRSIDWQRGDGTFRLNGKPYFQALVLDQGYWPETGLTPPSQDALKADIELTQAMGFNGCRKHQKVEDPLFLYWADRLGFLVWGEIANAYDFSAEYVDRFNQEWVEAVKRDINHPCIVTWTPGNESWGYPDLKGSIDQRNHLRSVYHITKYAHPPCHASLLISRTLDPSRPINDNCGWQHVETDLTTYHEYADSDKLKQICATMAGGILAPKSNKEMFTEPMYTGLHVSDPGAAHASGAPVICTEFGGVNVAQENKGERDWGYTTASDAKNLLERFEKLLMAIVEGGLTCGFVYTQL